jgi:hypothetical protein
MPRYLVCGAVREHGEEQLGDQLLSRIAEAVRPHRADGHGQAGALLEAHHQELGALLDQGLKVAKAGELLARRGVVVPERTPHRYALEVLEHSQAGRRGVTVRVADGEPGAECQVDFGRMSLLADPSAGHRRVVHALIFTAVYSRHCYVHLSFRQDLPAVIAGREAAVSAAFAGTPRTAGSLSTPPESTGRPASPAWSGWLRSCAAASSPARTFTA